MLAAALSLDGISSAKAGLWQSMQQSPTPKVSKSDEEFERMGVEFVWGYEGLSIDELNDLFSRVSMQVMHIPVRTAVKGFLHVCFMPWKCRPAPKSLVRISVCDAEQIGR